MELLDDDLRLRLDELLRFICTGSDGMEHGPNVGRNILDGNGAVWIRYDASALHSLPNVRSDTEIHKPVSYTHLDVYKRQAMWRPGVIRARATSRS